MTLISSQQITGFQVANLIQLAGDPADLAAALAASETGALLAEAVELHSPSAEGDGLDLRRPLCGESTRHQLSVGDVLDVPLLRADGSLHVVELKGSNIPKLVRRHRGPANPQTVAGRQEELPLIVGLEVHEAVGQVMNYLCHLDETRDHVLVQHNIDTRRASATVLVGHPKFVTEFSDTEISDTIRTYNSHLSRIEVMHYRDLIDYAERALALDAAPPKQEADRAAEESTTPWHNGNADPWAISDDSQAWPDEAAFLIWSRSRDRPGPCL